MRTLLAQLKLELEQLAERIAEMDRVIQQTASEHEGCKRMQDIPGIGSVTATAIIPAIGTGYAFGKGRDFAAWIGLVPGEHSTGGKQHLLRISKRGNPYLRKLFVQGARAVLQKRSCQTTGLSCWLERLVTRKHGNVAGSVPYPNVSMSSQLAIPRSGCTPALPASASPAGFIFIQSAETVNRQRLRVGEFSIEKMRNPSVAVRKFDVTRFSESARSAGEK